MQKKIVAAICAAALALALPMAAFAADVTVKSNGTASISDAVKGSNKNVSLSNIKFTDVNGSVEKIQVEAAGNTGAAPSNALPGSAASWTIKAKDTGWDNNLVNGLGQDATMTAQVSFKDAVIRDIPSSIAASNLYVGGNFVSAIEGKIPMNSSKINPAIANANQDATISAVSGDTSVSLTGVGTGTLTLWMQNGKYAAGDEANAAAVADEAKDASKSPKTGELL